jgi:predicted MFS family arabinose efflux permease
MQSRRLILIVMIFVGLSHGLYMFVNAAMFKHSYEQQNLSQMRELGQVLKKEIDYALGFGIPIHLLGGMTPFLEDVLSQTPDLAYIRIVQGDKVLFSAQRDERAFREIALPLAGGDPAGSKALIQEIRLGMGMEADRKMVSMLFDLITIVIAGLIIAYEIIRFFASRLVAAPFRESMNTLNHMIQRLNPWSGAVMPEEMDPITSRVRQRVTVQRQQVYQTLAHLNQVSSVILSTIFHGREQFLEAVGKQRASLIRLMDRQEVIKKFKDPSQIRPIVFLFFLGANLQSSFLPIFSRELLEKPTVLTGMFSEEILMGLPITCYMVTVFFFMLFMGSRWFKQKIHADYGIGIGTLCTSAGLVLCGLSNDILQLIAGRMLCAVGFAFIVIFCKQFIVARATAQNQAFHLAGFTAAFSGGLFCSIIIGSILVDYFSYRFVFFTAAAMVLLIFVFDYMILADKADIQPASARPGEPDSSEPAGLTDFFKRGATDLNLVCVLLHGIFTRIIFIGYFYYSVPILLKPDFAYADIGRIMMFYTLPSVLLAGFLNRRIRQIRQSRISVVGSNILVGGVLILFYFFADGPVWLTAVSVIVTLLVLGISNSITFPAQSGLLLKTRTAREMGARTALAVYNSIERIGSSLGPVFFGFFAALYDIQTAIVMGGALCVLGNLVFWIFFKPES